MGEINSNIIKSDWKKFVSGELPKKWDRYENDDAGSVSTEFVINAIRERNPGGFIEDISQNDDYIWDKTVKVYENLKREFLKECLEEDRDDIDELMEAAPESFFDVYREIYEDREINNWWRLAEGIDVLIWDDTKALSLGWRDIPNVDWKSEMNKNVNLSAFWAEASKYITWEQFVKLLDNGYDFDVLGYVGGIVGADEVLKAMASRKSVVVVDTTIVALWDHFNGAGYYIEGKGHAHINLKTDISVDFGNYSLGAVFGAGDWTWRA